MRVNPKGYRSHWHADEISEDIAGNPDTAFIFYAWDRMVQRNAGEGPPGRVIDVACGNARDVTKLTELAGKLSGWIHRWNSSMTRSGRLRMPRMRIPGTRRGRVPTVENAFDSLICKSALDHFVDRDQAMRECRRIVEPGGRVVVSANNYGGLTVRLSRLGYRIVRAIWPAAR